MARKSAGERPLAEILTRSALNFMPFWQTSAIDWQALTPFAAWLIEVVRPRTFVELGVYRGDSYCAMCQAIAEHDTGTRAWGIDTWAGDEHVGHYGTEILDRLRDHHDPRYGHFSRLMQMTFDDALDQFEDGSIDLLHIDGYHTYEAVRHDFDTWRPKLSERAIVIFHDTSVHERGFGVWKLWKELAEELPGRHFNLSFSNGLGIAVFDTNATAPIRWLCEASPEQAELYAQLFKALGDRVVGEAKIKYWRSQAEQASGASAADSASLAAELRAEFDHKLNAARETLVKDLRAVFDSKYVAHKDLGDLLDARFAPLRQAMVNDMRAEFVGKFGERQDIEVLRHELEGARSALQNLQSSLADAESGAEFWQLISRKIADGQEQTRARSSQDLRDQTSRVIDELGAELDQLRAELDDKIASLREASQDKEAIQDHEIHGVREALDKVLRHPIFR